MPKSIIGESFKPYVADQIKIRQQKLANVSFRDPDLLKYINNKTSWIRLSSGVNVSKDKLKELGLPDSLNGNGLAISNVLFSSYQYVNPGTNSDDWRGRFTAGIGYSPLGSYGYSSLNSYGFNSSADYGLVPPPGIKSVDIKALNRGSLREAKVEIECHSLSQFIVIEALYLKLKYSMLLEWGHTFWYDNIGNLKSNMPDWVHKGFLQGHYDQDKVLEVLEQQREEYCGNYDGFLGYVRNFEWSLRKDGGYDITLDLISIGDVIESLKVNTNYPTAKSSDAKKSNPEKTEIIANKDKSTIHQILHAIQEEINIQGYLDGFNGGGRSSLTASEIVRITKNNSQYDLKQPNYFDPKEITDWNRASNILAYQEAIKAYFSAITTDENGNATGGTFYYIKLGTLLRIVESFLLKYDTSKKDANNASKPLFYIDHDFDNNLCLTIPKQISLDPKVCLLKANTNISENNAEVVTEYIQITYTPIQEELAAFTVASWFGAKNNYFKKDIVIVSEFENGARLIASSDEIQEIKEDQTRPDNSKESRIVRLEGGVGFGQFTFNAADRLSNGGKVVFYYPSNNYSDKSRSTSINEEGNRKTTTNQNILFGLGNYFRVSDYPFLGKFMHIHVNLDFISRTLENNIDENGKVSVYDFLSQLMKGIQTAIGSINNFEVTYDEVTNYFIIRDNSTLPGANEYLKSLYPDLAAEGAFDIKPTEINAHLLTSNSGSFVLDVGIKSKLDNKFASTISIGAQANGNQVGENATALSKLNLGFEDRVIREKSDIISKDSEIEGSIEGEEKKTKSPEEVYIDNLIIYSNINNKINVGNITSDDISNSTQNIIDLFQYELGYYTQQGNIGGVGFIPIDLNLTVDGLSGPRIYESYTIDDTTLPVHYKNNVQFITVGVSHKIDSNGWVTMLDSISGPKQDNLKQITVTPVPVGNNQVKYINSSAPITIDPSRNLYNEAIKYKNYVYQLGAKGENVTINRGNNKGKTFAAIDCSGFVNKVLGTNLGNSETTTTRGTNFKQVSNLNTSMLKEGDVIGIDKGDYDYDKGRAYGIDHILIAIRNPNTNQLEIWESNGPSVSKYNDNQANSYGGVKSTLASVKVNDLNKAKKIFISSFIA
jgi:hypothetical protein